MARKIYIGKTYTTKFGDTFIVEKVVKGKSANSTDRRANKPRVAIDKEGNRIKITNLINPKQRLMDYDQIIKNLNKGYKKAASSKEEARKALYNAGIITEKGNLKKKYK